jgi:hypothetical protein
MFVVFVLCLLLVAYESAPSSTKCCGEVEGQTLVPSPDRKLLVCSDAASGNGSDRTHDMVRLFDLRETAKEAVTQKSADWDRMMPRVCMHDDARPFSDALLPVCHVCGQPLKAVVGSWKRFTTWLLCPGHYTLKSVVYEGRDVPEKGVYNQTLSVLACCVASVLDESGGGLNQHAGIKLCMDVCMCGCVCMFVHVQFRVRSTSGRCHCGCTYAR